MGVIRRATPADATSLAALAIEVWLSTYIKSGITPAFADYALTNFTPARVTAWIADRHTHISVSQNAQGIDGYIHIDDKSPDPVVGQIPTELVSLYVQPRHQGRGIGKALLDAVPAYHPFWIAVNSENTKALDFYAARGCTKIGETAFHIGDAAYPNDVLLAK